MIPDRHDRDVRDVRFEVNGAIHETTVDSNWLLIHLLRDILGLTGAHVGCVVGRCGACTVILNGRPVKSCMVLAVQADGSTIRTVEGLGSDQHLHPLQESFWNNDAVECGYCTSGMLMSAASLLERIEDPTEADIREAISGNLCRCTGYINILNAIRDVVESRRDASAVRVAGERDVSE